MRKVKLNANRVVRGGSWGFNASYLRAANRNYSTPSSKSNVLGARLVRGKR